MDIVHDSSVGMIWSGSVTKRPGKAGPVKMHKPCMIPHRGGEEETGSGVGIALFSAMGKVVMSTK
jgi:hypothetical protein